jgi:hypothetical protein
MPATTARAVRDPAYTIEDLFRSIRETEALIEKDRIRAEEWAEEYRRQAEERDEKIRIQAEKDKQEQKERQKILDRQFGELSNRFGDMTEYRFDPVVVKEKFGKLGYSMERSTRKMRIEDGAGDLVAEFDITLHNGSDIVLIEVKTKATQKDVEEHLERMNLMHTRKSFPGKSLIGAVASPIFTKEVKAFAIAHGLYAIDLVDDNVRIQPDDGAFKPKRW